MSHRTRERPAECLPLSHSTMIGLRARSTRELVHSLQMYCKLLRSAYGKKFTRLNQEVLSPRSIDPGQREVYGLTPYSQTSVSAHQTAYRVGCAQKRYAVICRYLQGARRPRRVNARDFALCAFHFTLCPPADNASGCINPPACGITERHLLCAARDTPDASFERLAVKRKSRPSASRTRAQRNDRLVAREDGRIGPRQDRRARMCHYQGFHVLHFEIANKTLRVYEVRHRKEVEQWFTINRSSVFLRTQHSNTSGRPSRVVAASVTASRAVSGARPAAGAPVGPSPAIRKVGKREREVQTQASAVADEMQARRHTLLWHLLIDLPIFVLDKSKQCQRVTLAATRRDDRESRPTPVRRYRHSTFPVLRPHSECLTLKENVVVRLSLCLSPDA
ncbi:hypothetical protein EVAR_20641_1 [Eumeta japonica]|uniref:Uncharacterized protein n=1 Tax=Eumeta variegata TaxID=151549 RepID=A0A4C1VBY8_EUMVA|nr:hypothetical protein EVAR_20641_1 [Eumeta japonica]